ncbi:hypothetical protein [Longitalea arenae]|uniref:hypothetical protein n=1 Tax=Longitalea arenae TaxID=2812558 RepID=UPI0019676798|nr:hypothetical protein [Longitalea arenae]
MKLTGILFVAISIITGCSQNCKEKIARIYSTNRKALENEREVNSFSLRLSYIPTAVLTHKDGKDAQAAPQDAAYYYFKLQVVCPEENNPGNGNTTPLYYGLDSLFATRETQPFANPVSVEPVITGNRKRFEYLLVFAQKDFPPGTPIKVVFFDRLFTNTKQVFVFDRKKIDEIETLQCYANEA